MRSIVEIQIAVQENKQDITETELRLCVESQRNIEHFLRQELIGLIKAVREDVPPSRLKMKAEFAWGTIERMFNAGKRSPDEWLGSDNIPGSKVQQQRLAWAKGIYKRATGDDL